MGQHRCVTPLYHIKTINKKMHYSSRFADIADQYAANHTLSIVAFCTVCIPDHILPQRLDKNPNNHNPQSSNLKPNIHFSYHTCTQ
jgi:hypothetical protein